jgi:hypothetical protein
MLSAIEERGITFAEGVLKQATAILDAAVAEVVFEDDADPTLYGVALLCRSISNFQGALAMARHDQAVECRTLVRLCFENLFLVDQLRRDGAGSVKALRSHEAWGRISLAETALKHPGVADTPQGKVTRSLLKSERLKSPKKCRSAAQRKAICRRDIPPI